MKRGRKEMKGGDANDLSILLEVDHNQDTNNFCQIE
jgi:hypothetical protein